MKEIVSREALDRSLMSGERQVATNVAEIDFWHVWRYQQAADLVKPGETVIDFGCGSATERASWLRSRSVIGVDDSAETIEFAQNRTSSRERALRAREH